MSEERLPMPSHPAPPGPGAGIRDPDGRDRPLDDPRALQILTTEHWSLLATRSLSWNESFSRAGLFLSVLSATAVALALVAQATSFGDAFLAFALVMLPIDLFIGLATFTRLDEVNGEDVLWVAGMNRLRHAYLEIGAGLSPYFVTGWSDDDDGLRRSFGIHPPGSALAHWLVTMPGMVAVIDAVLAGLIVALILMVPRMAMIPSIGVALGVAIAVGAVLLVRSRQGYQWRRRAIESRFPSARTRGAADAGSGEAEDRSSQPGT
jgi:hypothetical protein